MKHLRETFTDQEFAELQQLKGKLRHTDSGKKLSWHDFVIFCAGLLKHYSDANWSTEFEVSYETTSAKPEPKPNFVNFETRKR